METIESGLYGEFLVILGRCEQGLAAAGDESYLQMLGEWETRGENTCL